MVKPDVQKNDVVVEVEGLSKTFNGVAAVEGVSFRIHRGEIVGLLGPNGAGKTTIIQMLLGVLTPTAGTVRLFGLDVHRHRESVLGRVNFSSTYVSLPYSLTVTENLRVFARLYRLPHPEARIRELLQRFELEPTAHQLVRGLSSGQLTRLCLAKALLNRPEVLFLDEPTASLDPDMAEKTRRLLRDVRAQEHTAMLYTSHNMREMEQMCDRILFLHRGRIIAAGTPREVLSAYGEEDLEALFLRIARGGSRVEAS